MDYLEGFLIGPVWSDTEYQTRRHVMVHVMLAVLITALYIAMLVVPALRELVLIVPFRISIISFIILLFITPFISAFYYRVPGILRPFLLLFYVATYVFAMISLLYVVLPLYEPDAGQIINLTLERINNRIDVTTSFFTFLGPLFSMIAGIIAGGLWTVGEGILLVLGIVAVPLFVILFIKGFRQLLDSLIMHVVFGSLRRRR